LPVSIIPLVHNRTFTLGYLSWLSIHSYSSRCTLQDIFQAYCLWIM
jgi:hypothetical protein